ncbi:hypothetical protein P4U23_14680 [Aeribacillus composti]|uniref:hypothetical protein n=1 Tax=Aeribacillus composti TaxID=1868734 RepID=UPI002E24C27B|nr:hypothetical protein [Aeribacillus composti]
MVNRTDHYIYTGRIIGTLKIIRFGIALAPNTQGKTLRELKKNGMEFWKRKKKLRIFREVASRLAPAAW